MPEIVVDKVTFIVDVAFAEIINKQCPSSRESFHRMERQGNSYIIHIHPELQILSADPHPDFKGHPIGQMVELDPEGVCKKYGLERHELPGDDRALNCDVQLVQKRLDGALPQINIAGHDYFVDLRTGELRGTDDPTRKIVLDRLEQTDHGGYTFFFNHSKGAVVKIDYDAIDREPADVVLVELPKNAWLDPVGEARRRGLDGLALLGTYPLQHGLSARVHLLEHTYVPVAIQKNIERRSKDYIDDDPRPDRIRRRGKRL